MGVGGGPGVTQDAGYRGRRRRETLIGRVGGRRGDADDGSSEILFSTVQLQVPRLGIETGSAGGRDRYSCHFSTEESQKPIDTSQHIRNSTVRSKVRRKSVKSRIQSCFR